MWWADDEEWKLLQVRELRNHERLFVGQAFQPALHGICYTVSQHRGANGASGNIRAADSGLADETRGFRGAAPASSADTRCSHAHSTRDSHGRRGRSTA